MSQENKMEQGGLQMKFDPLVIDDLGARLYSTLPPVLAELIANGYDACATRINIEFYDDEKEKKIIISDNGLGMSYKEVAEKYLIIGRKRRDSTPRRSGCGRLPIGKKGLGKLAFFGIAGRADIETVRDSKVIVFGMDWDEIQNTKDGNYKPKYTILNLSSVKVGTKIVLTKIHKKSDFDLDSIKKSIANYFIFDNSFRVFVNKNGCKYEEIKNELRYEQLGRKIDFSREFPGFGVKYLGKDFSFSKKIKGKIILFDKPVRSNIRGVTLFSRRKLVNLPEFFPAQGSSFFYQYLTGWLEIDFIDEFIPDVISTNRSSLNWNDENLRELKEFLERAINLIHGEWREEKKEKTEKNVSRRLGMSVSEWKESNKNNSVISKNIGRLSEILNNPEEVDAAYVEKFTDIVYELAPRHADFVLWRNLNEKIKDNPLIQEKFFDGKYLEATREAVQIYNEEIQDITGSTLDGCPLMDEAFKNISTSLIDITAKSDDSEKNIDLGQQFLSKGIITGFRNPALGHTSLTKGLKLMRFSEKNCLDILGTISYLFDRLDQRKRPARV